MADLSPSKLARLESDECFSAGDATVLDFWRWALGDLRMNTARGAVAEFLVARAVRSVDPVRIEWAAHDVKSAEGVRVEVKSSGYLQSWWQRQRSAPRWGLTGAKEVWNPTSGSYEHDPAGRVDVWVFALHACTTATPMTRSMSASGAGGRLPCNGRRLRAEDRWGLKGRRAGRSACSVGVVGPGRS